MSSTRVQKLEERIEKRKQRIEKMQEKLREERAKLNKDEETLLHVKYDEVLKRMAETGVSPDDALQAIDNKVEKLQSNSNQSQENKHNHEGGQRYGGNH